MKKKMKRFPCLILISLLSILFAASCKGKEASKAESLTICTEESLKFVVEDVTKYFNDKRETPVEFQITYIPENETERASTCKQLRTELMTGKGADIYILSDHKRNGGLSVDEDTLLLPDANRTLYSGVFTDLSDYTADDESFRKCFAPIMEAGAAQGKQYIIPFTFDAELIKADKSDDLLSLSREDCSQPLSQLIKEGKIKSLYPQGFLFDVSGWIGSSFDYQKGNLYFSEDDISYVLGYAVENAVSDAADEIPRYNFNSGENESLHSDDFSSDDLQAAKYEYLPMVTLDGRPAARILSYGAVSRTCKAPQTAYEVLQLFWQDDFISRDGLRIPHEDFTAYYHNATILNLGGIPVREDLWEQWYLIKNGTSEPTQTAVENAQSFSDALKQTVTARFLCTVDSLGTEISNMFMKDGRIDLDREGIEEDIRLAADMLYNNIRYTVTEQGGS